MSVTLHTNVGDIKIELFCDLCPRSAENFLGLCASGQYNGVKFHRNVPGFIIQGGDTEKKGGKGGKSITGNPFNDEIRDGLRHDKRGVVAWATSGPNKNQSQFYITYDKAPHLNNTATVFGQVIHGLETLRKMEKTGGNAKEKYQPKSELRIDTVTIHANPIATSGKSSFFH